MVATYVTTHLLPPKQIRGALQERTGQQKQKGKSCEIGGGCCHTNVSPTMPIQECNYCSSKERLITQEGDPMLDYCSKEDWRRRVGKLHFPAEGLPPILSLPRMVPLRAPHHRSYPRLSDWVQMGELRSPWDKMLQDCKKKERKKERTKNIRGQHISDPLYNTDFINALHICITQVVHANIRLTAHKTQRRKNNRVNTCF